MRQQLSVDALELQAAAALRMDGDARRAHANEAPPRESILRLDAVNQPLAVLASLWAQAEPTERSPDADDRIPLADLARAPK